MRAEVVSCSFTHQNGKKFHVRAWYTRRQRRRWCNWMNVKLEILNCYYIRLKVNWLEKKNMNWVLKLIDCNSRTSISNSNSMLNSFSFDWRESGSCSLWHSENTTLLNLNIDCFATESSQYTGKSTQQQNLMTCQGTRTSTQHINCLN